MRKMAELQLTVVKDPRSRQAIIKQISQWEENLEKLFVDQYRLRCYIASLQGSELPNPKVMRINFFPFSMRCGWALVTLLWFHVSSPHFEIMDMIETKLLIASSSNDIHANRYDERISPIGFRGQGPLQMLGCARIIRFVLPLCSLQSQELPCKIQK